MKNRFASNIKYLRNVIGLLKHGKFLSQSEFSELIGISRRTLINWESGELPNITHRQKLITLIKNTLNVDIHEEVLLEKDIAHVIGPMSIYMYPEIISGLSKKQRQLLQHLMLKIDNLTEDSLKYIIEQIDKELEKERIRRIK